MKKLLTIGPLFIIIAALLWSFDGILRRSLYTLPPTVVVFYEHLLGAGVMLFFFKKWIKDLPKMTRKEWLGIGSVALFSGALGTIFYTAALGKVQYVQYSVVVLLQQTQPIWAILAASLIVKEKITPRFALYATLALIAAYLISFKELLPNFLTGEGTTIAALLALGAGALWGASTALSKYVLNKVSFITATALRFFLTPIFALMIILGGGDTSSLFTLNSEQWTTLLIITFSTGLLALGIYYYGLKKTQAKISTLCELVFPASAIYIDYFYFNNPLSITQIGGVILLLFVLYKVARMNTKKS
jgi:drug/metabolite transporter (DMT)-like permease